MKDFRWLWAGLVASALAGTLHARSGRLDTGADQLTLTAGPPLEIVGSTEDRRIRVTEPGRPVGLRERDSIAIPDGATGEVAFGDGAVLKLQGPGNLRILRLREDGRSLDLTYGTTALFRLGPVPTTLGVGPEVSARGSNALLEIARGPGGASVLRLLEGAGLEMSGTKGIPDTMASGQELIVPVPGGRAGREGSEDCRARSFTFAGRLIVIPDGVSARVEKGRLVIRACPGQVKGSVVVMIGNTAVALGPDGELTLDLTGQIVAGTGLGGRLRPVGFPMDRGFDTPRDASPTRP